jgi:hypothetical protein
VLNRTLQTTLLVVLACAPAAVAAPRAHTAAEQRAEAALVQAEDVLAGQDVRSGREATDALRELSMRLKHLRGDERERAIKLLSRPTDSDAPDDERYLLPELPPLCNADFCVHSVGSGVDLPSIGMAALTLAEADKVHDFENGTLGWREPPDDGDGRIDIYLKELGEQKLFGFAATDPGQDQLSQHSYLVIDNDFDPAQYGGVPALESLRVTLAHEYAHVLQYGYDVTADGWHYESTAVWMEQRMYPEIKDWLRFVNDRSTGAGWRSLTELPLTAFDHPDDQPRNAKPYGNVVWNQFLSERYGNNGDGIQLDTWENSNGLEAPSTAAYNTAIRAAGGQSLATDFAAFSAAVAEWRTPQAPFPTPSELPDVERRGSLIANGNGTTLAMDHLTFALYDVPATTAAPIRLAASFPEGSSAAIALVARSGSVDGGSVTTNVLPLPDGGIGGVTIQQPAQFYNSGGRITAVLVNSDSTHGSWNEASRDWRWLGDDKPVQARITSDTSVPALSARTPGPNASRVSTRGAVTITFSEPVAGVNDKTFVLRKPNGKRVPAAVTYTAATRTATLIPTNGLSDTTRYTARVGGSILNAAANAIVPTEWTFTTVRRLPRASLNGFTLRSRDADRLRWTATLRQGGRTVGRRSGTLRPGASRSVRVSGGEAGRARLVVVLVDPQGNRRRISRRVRLTA